MRIIFFGLLILSVINACSPAEGNQTGHEYMPDMSHSVAYEANIDNYYFYHTWGSKEDYHKLSMPRNPVKGTIPRGAEGNLATDSTSKLAFQMEMNGTGSYNAIRIPSNGHVDYYYSNTEEERLRASREIVNNLMPLTANGLAQGKYLYNIYCGICHGEKGDGAGYLVRDDGAYPAQPANFLKDEFIAANEGRFYHAIMYGKNVMGSYADKLSYEERWNVIHYIRSMQATSKNLVYNEKQNTFKGSQAVVDALKSVVMASTAAKTTPVPTATNTVIKK